MNVCVTDIYEIFMDFFIYLSRIWIRNTENFVSFSIVICCHGICGHVFYFIFYFECINNSSIFTQPSFWYTWTYTLNISMNIYAYIYIYMHTYIHVNIHIR